MIQHTVLITFKDDIDSSTIDEFIDVTNEIFATTPFRSVVHGRGIGAVPNGADWAYSGVLESDDITVWREHPSHIRLRDLVMPMTAQVSHIQLNL